MSGKESRRGGENNPEDVGANSGADEAPESYALDGDEVNADAEVGKLAKDLEDLRQTLLRRQADFDNYRKRIEKERGEDSRAVDRAGDRGIDSGDGWFRSGAGFAPRDRNTRIIARASS